MMKVLLILILLIPLSAFAQLSKQGSIWLPLAPFLSSWEGTSSGQPGEGTYTRSYNFIFGGKFIEVRNLSVYPPAERNPKGEVHEEFGYISFDRFSSKFVLRQFHIEGFVNQFVLDSLSTDGKTIVLLATAIENIPEGSRAKETYPLVSDNEFIEVFELAAPSRPFEVYTRATFQRTRSNAERFGCVPSGPDPSAGALIKCTLGFVTWHDELPQ